MADFEIVIDSYLPSKLAAFWVEVFQNYSVRPYDQSEIARLHALGFTPETDPSVAMDGPGPTIWFQKSVAFTHDRNRMHFDLKVDDIEQECARLELLGAVRQRNCVDHVVMHDPEGNQFCLFAKKREQT